jgi:glycerol-3-phosphate acyltransferase PlsX
VGFRLLKEGTGDVFISAGNSGALLTGATLLIGRIKGIDRPAIAPMLPAYNKGFMLIDARCKYQL